MRLVSWNCGGAFHRKWSHLAELKPDVAIVSECCQPDRAKDLGFTSSAWVGRLHYKGLAVFGFGDWRVEQRPMEHQLEWVLPVDVSGPESSDRGAAVNPQGDLLEAERNYRHRWPKRPSRTGGQAIRVNLANCRRSGIAEALHNQRSHQERSERMRSAIVTRTFDIRSESAISYSMQLAPRRATSS
jgi:hypothetical protein